MPLTQLNELAVDPIRQRTELNELFVNDIELNLHHSDIGQIRKHSQQSAPTLHPGDKPRAGGLGFPLKGT